MVLLFCFYYLLENKKKSLNHTLLFWSLSATNSSSEHSGDYIKRAESNVNNFNNEFKRSVTDVETRPELKINVRDI